MPALVLAAGIPTQIVPANCAGPNAAVSCKVCDIATLAQNIINAAIFLAVFLSAILFAWAGVVYMTAGGEAGKLGEAKRIFINVGIGLVMILTAWLLIDTIMATFTGSHMWNKLC
jgi:hypothetical protein